jgi:hypothetical protein
MDKGLNAFYQKSVQKEVHFIQKPFTIKILAAKVKEALKDTL